MQARIPACAVVRGTPATIGWPPLEHADGPTAASRMRSVREGRWAGRRSGVLDAPGDGVRQDLEEGEAGGLVALGRNAGSGPGLELARSLEHQSQEVEPVFQGVGSRGADAAQSREAGVPEGAAATTRAGDGAGFAGRSQPCSGVNRLRSRSSPNTNARMALQFLAIQLFNGEASSGPGAGMRTQVLNLTQIAGSHAPRSWEPARGRLNLSVARPTSAATGAERQGRPRATRAGWGGGPFRLQAGKSQEASVSSMAEARGELPGDEAAPSRRSPRRPRGPR